MSKPRVLLISSQHLFGESMEMFLRTEKDIELVGPWNLGEQDICRRLLEVKPSVVVIADENLQSEIAAELTKSIIEQYSELSVIRAGLSENVFRIFSTQTLPARGADLLETIHNCIARTQDSNSHLTVHAERPEGLNS
jgi:DNA-binding NarL/FixJ family response regulator